MAEKDRFQKMRDAINKAAGKEISYNLNEKNPTKVVKWISTGSRWLDSIICSKDQLPEDGLGGLPVGRIVELAGLESSGKTYMAAQIAVRAQKMGFDIIWSDGEFQLSPDFFEKMGMDLNAFIFNVGWTLEDIFENIEFLLGFDRVPKLFIIDSVAATPTRRAIDGGFDPLSQIADKARVLSLALQKLTTPLGDHGSILLALNQLKTFIPVNPADRTKAMIHPYVTQGGKSFKYHSSLIIYLTKREGKDHFIYDDAKEKIGSHVRARVEKSRFGTEGREAEFKILWRGNEIKVCDEESWLEAIKKSPRVTPGSWWSIDAGEGKEPVKFQSSKWLEKLQEPEFKALISEILDEVLIK